MRTTPFLRLAALAAAAGIQPAAHAAGCESVLGLSIDHTEITSVEVIAPGAFRVDGEGPRSEAVNAAMEPLPGFCRVVATSRPTDDSEIGIEVWLPTAGWNGKLQAVGNGGWAGSISYSALAGAVAAGYAAASTDTGHEGGTVDFAIGHPEKLVDFAHRAVHEMTVTAKAIVAAHYGEGPQYAYFAGCSTGGRQALAEAQRYPEDYDGIVAGAAAYHPSHLQGMQVWAAAVSHRNERAVLVPADLSLVNDAVIRECDALDGVADGVIENPGACRFDPATLVCADGSDAACLSPEQAETVTMIHAGPTAANGESLFPGLARGSERGWTTLGGDSPLTLADDTYRYLVHDDPDWDYRNFDAEREFPIAAARIGPLMNSTDPDLEPFFARGGRLLMYHGWNDPGIPAMASVEYYESVVETVGASRADDAIRLFMVPGMNHCRGGVGTDRFDAVAALDQWVSTGHPPERIEAARVEGGEAVRTRPLCPYPQVAVYDGSGSSDAAENFACR